MMCVQVPLAAMERLLSRTGRWSIQRLQLPARRHPDSACAPSSAVVPWRQTHRLASVSYIFTHPGFRSLSHRLQNLGSHECLLRQSGRSTAGAGAYVHTSSVLPVRITPYSNFGHKQKPPSKYSIFYCIMLGTVFIGFFGFNGYATSFLGCRNAIIVCEQHLTVFILK